MKLSFRLRLLLLPRGRWNKYALLKLQFFANKKLQGTSASLLVTSALLVEQEAIGNRNKKLLGTSASLLVKVPY